MTDPDQIARRIAADWASNTRREACAKEIAAALREYGDLEFKRGQITISPNLRNDVAELVVKVAAEGFRRGVEHQKSMCYCDGIIKGHAEHEHQRGQEGGSER